MPESAFYTAIAMRRFENQPQAQLVCYLFVLSLRYQNSSMNLQQRIEQNIAGCIPCFEATPGMVTVHHLQPSSVVYMSSCGLKVLGVSLEELQEMGVGYNERFFNPQDAEEYVPKVLGMLERNDKQETISYFQQVRADKNDPWLWYVSGTRIFMHDDEGKPHLTITVAMPIDVKHYFTNKIDRLLKENVFLNSNRHLFDSLTRREKEILALLACNKTSSEMAAVLFLSEATVKTHRRNIKRKLNVKTLQDTLMFAQLFNLS